MSFGNEKVLAAVLEACEPDINTRESCMDLKGLPLDYVFTANDKLDYMERFGTCLTDCHINIHQEYIQRSIPIELKPNLNFVMSDGVEWFINFNFEMTSLINRHINTKNIILLLTPTEYMLSRFSSQYENWYKKSIKAVRGLSQKFDNKAPWYSNVEDASSNYEELLMPVLNFLSSGVEMDNNTPLEIVEVWVGLFNLFATIDPYSWKFSEYEEGIDNGF
jgi:hypothetical protein